MKITIEANKGEGIAFTTAKILTTLSTGPNVVMLIDKDDYVDGVAVVPYAQVLPVESHEWERFEDKLGEFVNKLIGLVEIPFTHNVYLLIDSRYMQERIANRLIAIIENKTRKTICPVIIRYFIN